MADSLLDYYQAIEKSSLQMLDAARAQDWAGVVEHEGTCAILIEQLRLSARTQELLPAQRSEKTKIMQRILMNDAQLRYLAEPWLEHFEQKGDLPVVLH